MRTSSRRVCVCSVHAHILSVHLCVFLVLCCLLMMLSLNTAVKKPFLQKTLKTIHWSCIRKTGRISLSVYILSLEHYWFISLPPHTRSSRTPRNLKTKTKQATAWESRKVMESSRFLCTFLASKKSFWAVLDLVTIESTGQVLFKLSGPNCPEYRI